MQRFERRRSYALFACLLVILWVLYFVIRHDWRAELISKLASLQKPDGSWVGEKKWMEDNPVLVTAYSVIALEEAKQDLAEHPAK